MYSEYFKEQEPEVISTKKTEQIQEEATQTQETKIEIPIVVAPTNPIIVQEKPKAAQIVAAPHTQEANKIVIAPSMNFIKNMQHKSIEYNSEPTQVITTSKQRQVMQAQNPPAPTYIEDTFATQEVALTQTPAPEINKFEERVSVEEIPKASVINIKRQDAYSDIDEIIKRFKKSNNPALSLFIAKKYYELGEYREAYNYALVTNELNKEIEASWILFAQSLVKLGDRDKAVKVLKEYANQSHSNRATLLLDDILSGKFK